jgi:dethiobiotin synthetase
MQPSWSASVPDLVVTGTDTGVGKTVIAAALVVAQRINGVRAIGFKPVETGLEQCEEPDSAILARVSADTTPLAAPLLQLQEALAPAVAADRAGVSIRAGDIEARVDRLRREGYSLVIEGAGGVMVPLLWGYTVLDLAEHFDLEAVVVARAGLGTLNHIAMTVAMLRARNISVRGVVLNGRSPSPNLAESTNPSALAHMDPGLTIVEVPRHASVDVIATSVPFVSPLLTDPKRSKDITLLNSIR